MHCTTLPEPRQNLALACRDPATARHWLSQQPAAQPLSMLAALQLQVEAIDAAGLPPASALELLNLLRSASLAALNGLEARFLRKALPLPEEDQHCFDASQQFYQQLGIAYLRLAPGLPASERGLPLQRAAIAFRMAQYAHFQAASETPSQLDEWLLACLAEGQLADCLQQPLADPDFPAFAEASLAGQLAWAFLLRAIDPYRLSVAELLMANRAFGRWRELASFQAALDADPKAVQLDLLMLCAMPLPDAAPRWLNVRPVARKLRQRIEALKAGESPESLKLGRELSAAACLRLLRELDGRLRQRPRPLAGESGEISLSFGGENAYAMFNGEWLNPRVAADSRSTAIAHQRMAIFGFDRQSQLPNTVKKLTIPSEVWRQGNGLAGRSLEQDGARRQSPCLIATKHQGKPQLGVLTGLKTLRSGGLSACLKWYPASVETGSLKALPNPGSNAAKVPVFLLLASEGASLIVPASTPVRLNALFELSGLSISLVLPGEVLERGVDFVRYAVKPA